MSSSPAPAPAYHPPKYHTQLACTAAGYYFGYTARGVPTGYKIHSKSAWSSICWFGRGHYYKVFLNGEGYGCARTVPGVLQLVRSLP